MENLYIVELDIRPPSEADTSVEQAQRLLDVLVHHAARWVDPQNEHQLDPAALSVDGNITVHRSPRRTEPSSVRWMRVDSPQASALRMEVVDPLNDTTANFLSRITMVRIGNKVTYRHALARETHDGILQPARVQDLERPGLVRSVLQDRNLTCRSQGVVVDGRYQRVQNENELNWLVAMLGHERRPPILIIDTVQKERIEFAKEAAQRLAGLALVYAIPAVALLRAFNDSHPAWDVPFSGARLVWPGQEHRHPIYFTHETDHRTVSSMLRLLAGVSVAARGFDSTWAKANSAYQAHQSELRAAEADRRLADALANSDLEQQIELLRVELESEREEHRKTRADHQEWEAIFEAPDLPKMQQELGSLRFQLQAERDRYEALLRRSGAVSPDEAPALPPNDLTDVADFLERASGGGVVFTTAARRSWGKSGYPNPSRMRGALVALTQAAIEWRELRGAIGQSKADWMKTTFGLNVAYSDDGLVNAGKADFTYDGQTWSRVPHVKLDDHVAPNEVGRVYFAEDPDSWRFIIDHVGLKLYGL